MTVCVNTLTNNGMDKTQNKSICNPVDDEVRSEVVCIECNPLLVLP